ncbi:MAG: hypothetical protein UY87_C0023G0008 [Candidatus Peribacteria bacterium GW2011_GWC2_54_8]|nr:MAG: hypothetical protein UY87_C0023G0008 [Candidatus Peribacteria bacterium GW2011_GWC2_54_8]
MIRLRTPTIVLSGCVAVLRRLSPVVAGFISTLPIIVGNCDARIRCGSADVFDSAVTACALKLFNSLYYSE